MLLRWVRFYTDGLTPLTLDPNFRLLCGITYSSGARKKRGGELIAWLNDRLYVRMSSAERESLALSTALRTGYNWNIWILNTAYF